MNILTKNELALIRSDCLYANSFSRFQGSDNAMLKMALAGYVYEPRTPVDETIIANLDVPSLTVKSVTRDGRQTAVIVSTGAYSPVHEGHLAIMDQAKAQVESMGYQVVQGVMSASHDAYVSTKYNGQAKMQVGKRTQLLFDAIESRPWLTLDRLEGELVSCAINFSTVLKRVRSYLIRHNPELDETLQVFYVFGSDNAGFCDAFVGNQNYHAVCVTRGDVGVDDLKIRYAGEPNVHFVESTLPSRHFSSSAKRANQSIDSKAKPATNGVYMVRTDGVPEAFSDALCGILTKYMPEGVELKTLNGKDLVMPEGSTISMDKYMRGQYNIDVSRLFELSSGQRRARGLVSLSLPLREQVKAIPPGLYTLMDDDTVTGITMDRVTEALKEAGITVAGRETLVNQALAPGQTLYDIVDARDFLIESGKGGLVVEAYGKQVRAPYLFPFVNVVSRASIKPEDQYRFCREVYALNLSYIDSVNVLDLEPNKREFFAALKQFSTVVGFCRYYINALDNLLEAIDDN